MALDRWRRRLAWSGRASTPASSKCFKYAAGGSAGDRMLALQAILAAKPPPWLAKVMGQTPEERVRFERDLLDAGEAQA